MNYRKLNKNELLRERERLYNFYKEFKLKNLNLDMSRGKPCREQLNLSLEMLNPLDDYYSQNGMDCLNYGGLEGIEEAKELFTNIFEVEKKEVIVGGNSSLNLMYDTLLRAMMFGVYGSEKPWIKMDKIKFICPCPGYDRHFSICEQLNIEMIPVEMNNEGPDMDEVERMVLNDDSIKGIWCVPKYSNPSGITYSDEVVSRIANMKTKASDFRVFWDNAYIIHHLYDEKDKLVNILTECKKYGNADRVYMFTSTSKITFPGAGIAAMAASENNINYLKKLIAVQTIGPDKINQLRHVRFFKDLAGLEQHMKKHAEILRPKFDAFLEVFERELGSSDIAWWSKPKGGYFISLNTMDGCASKVVDLALKAGVTLTKAGATYPYGKDFRDRNIRIAPSYPPVEELRIAAELLTICIKIVSTEKLLN